jgi:spore coat protein A, manganese oxidase
VDTVEIWRIINLIDDVPHPIHIHLVDIQILERQPFDVSQYQKTGNLIFTGPPTPPEPYETGFKETVRTPLWLRNFHYGPFRTIYWAFCMALSYARA